MGKLYSDKVIFDEYLMYSVAIYKAMVYNYLNLPHRV